MKIKWVKVLQYIVGKPVGLGDQIVPNLCQVHTNATFDFWGSFDIVVAQRALGQVHMSKDLLVGSVADDIHQLYFPFQENILTRVEEHSGQHCQTSSTFSDSSWRLEEREEDLHTARMAAVSLARSKPTLDHSTTLRCWVCEHHHKYTDVRAGRGLLFSSFPFTTPFPPGTAVLFPSVLKISRFGLNVKKSSRLFHFPWGRLFYIQIDFTVKELCPVLFSHYQFQCCCLNNSFPLSWCATFRYV